MRRPVFLVVRLGAAHHAAAVVAFAVQTGAVLYERQAAQFTTAASA